MSVKDRNRLREIIENIEVQDFDFKEVKVEGEIKCKEIKITNYISTDSQNMHRVNIPKVTVSMLSWYSKYEQDAKYYDEKSKVIKKNYDVGCNCFEINDETYNAFKSTIENAEYIKTKGNVMYALFSNNDKLNEIKKLKLFSSFAERVYWGYPFKGWTGDVFARSRMEVPIYTERNKILNLVDGLSDYTEADKQKLVATYKSFLQIELKKCEDQE